MYHYILCERCFDNSVLIWKTFIEAKFVFPLDTIIDVTDNVEVGMILGGWGIERPVLIRSDGIVCSKNKNKDGDGMNILPKYPQVKYISK